MMPEAENRLRMGAKWHTPGFTVGRGFKGTIHPAQLLRCIAAALPSDTVVEVVTPIPRVLKSWLREHALRGPIFQRSSYRFLNEGGRSAELANLISSEPAKEICVYIFAYVGGKDVLFWEVGDELYLGRDLRADTVERCLAEFKGLVPLEPSNG